MKDVKKEKNLIGKENWPTIGLVKVEGIKNAQTLPPNLSVEEGEKILSTWKDIAVLGVSPQVPFYLGFIVGEHSQFLKSEVETENGRFGMRVGSEDVTFFVLPKDLETEMKLELKEVTNVDNPDYRALPLY